MRVITQPTRKCDEILQIANQHESCKNVKDYSHCNHFLSWGFCFRVHFLRFPFYCKSDISSSCCVEIYSLYPHGNGNNMTYKRSWKVYIQWSRITFRWRLIFARTNSPRTWKYCPVWQNFPLFQLIIFFTTVHNFQSVSSKAETPEFEKSIYNPSGMYGMKVGSEISCTTYNVGHQAMDPGAPEYQYPGQTRPQLPGVRAASSQKEVRKIGFLEDLLWKTYFLIGSYTNLFLTFELVSNYHVSCNFLKKLKIIAEVDGWA